MSRRRRGRITVQSQPTGVTRAARRMGGVVQAIVGFVFVCIAIGEIMPLSFLFSLPFLTMGGFAMVMGLINVFSKNGLAHRVGYDVETGVEEETIVGLMDEVTKEDSSSPSQEFHDHIPSTALDAKARLEQLETLKSAGLISQKEYEEKRQKILAEL
ncbi:MAG: hypothetical protein ACOX7N_01230 [Lawsonibacter sp.]|jgi:hypothetical protein